MKIQIDDNVRDATKDELAQIATIQNDAVQRLTALETAAAAKASARAKLAALGLTDEEISAFLGA